MKTVIISCPDCEGKGKKLERVHVANLFNYRTWLEETPEDCPRCSGYGSIKVADSDLKLNGAKDD